MGVFPSSFCLCRHAYFAVLLDQCWRSNTRLHHRTVVRFGRLDSGMPIRLFVSSNTRRLQLRTRRRIVTARRDLPLKFLSHVYNNNVSYFVVCVCVCVFAFNDVVVTIFTRTARDSSRSRILTRNRRLSDHISREDEHNTRARAPAHKNGTCIYRFIFSFGSARRTISLRPRRRS